MVYMTIEKQDRDIAHTSQGSPVPRTNLQAYPPSPRSDEDDIAKRTSSEGSLIAEVGRDKEETVETEAAQVDTPSLFSKLPTEIRYQICKEASATRSTVSASHCTVDTSGIEAMTNLMLVSKQMHQDVINSALCDNRFFIAVNDFHLMFFSKQLHRHKLCRFTPPAFCKLVKHWQIHIHFGEDPSLTWPGPGRVCLAAIVSWICIQLGDDSKGIRSIALSVHGMDFLRNEPRTRPLILGYMREMVIDGLDMITTRVHIIDKLEVTGAEEFLGTKDWRDCPGISWPCIGQPVYCAKEKDWYSLCEEAHFWMIYSKCLRDQVYRLWILIDNPHGYVKAKRLVMRTLFEVSHGLWR